MNTNQLPLVIINNCWNFIGCGHGFARWCGDLATVSIGSNVNAHLNQHVVLINKLCTRLNESGEQHWEVRSFVILLIKKR